MNRELISGALGERFRELCSERIPHTQTEACGPANFFRHVQEKFAGSSPEEVRAMILYPRGLTSWTRTHEGCRRSLMTLSVGWPLELLEAERPPAGPFLEQLNAARNNPALRALLLSERYSSPLSFTLAEEDEARELLLARLMTSDRVLMEKGAAEAVAGQDFLLRLNLIAVHAARSEDLRFLDALNYYYELPYDKWSPTVRNDTLMASYLALYAQALSARM